MGKLHKNTNLDKASFLSTKQKEKELALEKAQVAESSLEELKERFRELRRQEEKMLREVEQAEADGRDALDALVRESDALKASKAAAGERRAAAERDRAALFAEAQGVEREVRAEKAKKAEAQQQAGHYRGLLEKVL